MKKIILIIMLGVFCFARSNFSEPIPTFDNPRKVIFSIHTADLKKVNATLGSMYNIQKEYPAESLHMVVVAYGKGLRILRKDFDKATKTRIKSLMQYDVEFIGCKNTMDSMHWKEKDFLDGVEFVQAGIAEIIERKVAGYIGINAY
ncbi:DsrE family protein [Arcobacter sp. CECT 8985]|uniref:DsrE family protein n=1 Tax=Arcobacter sp. CECT 8985 TaxID=1935424 RepID=UPI002159CBD0|nr:DsrE family protein [Arcobacter sp. CECT 8985]